MTYMIKSIYDGRKMPIQYAFAQHGTSAAQLQFDLKQIIEDLTKCGFIVLAIICDQSKVNEAAINRLTEYTKRQTILEECLQLSK